MAAFRGKGEGQAGFQNGSEGKMPTINTDKVCFIVVKARELESEDEGVEPDASNATDDGFVSVLTEDAFPTIRKEISSFIESMDIDEQVELVALMWVGRGDFVASEWNEAVRQARARHEGATSTYLLGVPLLASFLEGGLAEFGESCELYAADRQ
ncbi:MAG: DUF3775 domain-containing protein [Methylocystis sp.]|uniref:DUF3775 domain-containing protein n=1 Tax=Methylocystis sp. TaxID=1911079 RepID=UPI003D0EC1B1